MYVFSTYANDRGLKASAFTLSISRSHWRAGSPSAVCLRTFTLIAPLYVYISTSVFVCVRVAKNFF